MGTAFIPVVGEIASPILGGVSLATGVIATAKDYHDQNWTGLAFDTASLIPGGTAEIKAVKTWRTNRGVDQAIENISTYTGTDTTKLQALIDNAAQLNNSYSSYDEWGKAYGLFSAGIATVGELANECGIDDLLNARLMAFYSGN